MTTPTPPSPVVRPADHDRDPLGRILNPDTGLPYASLAHRDAADLADYAQQYGITGEARDALVLLVTRVRTRAKREDADRLRHLAQLRADNARYALASLSDADALDRAYRSGIEAAVLRSVAL
jgi:hypothetical protein